MSTVHHNGLESSLVQMSEPAVPAVIVAGIGNIELSHELRQIGSGRLDNQVKMLCEAARYVKLGSPHF